MPDFLGAMDRLRQALTNQPGAAANADQMLHVNLATLLAGEDTTVGVIKVEERFGYTYINAASGAGTANNVKSGAGFLHGIVINKPCPSELIQIGDGTASGSGVFAAITLEASIVGPQPRFVQYDVTFANGLTIMTGSNGAIHDITVSWR